MLSIKIDSGSNSTVTRKYCGLINRINDLNNLPENCLLALFDAVGLYPRLQHEERMSALPLRK